MDTGYINSPSLVSFTMLQVFIIIVVVSFARDDHFISHPIQCVETAFKLQFPKFYIPCRLNSQSKLLANFNGD